MKRQKQNCELRRGLLTANGGDSERGRILLSESCWRRRRVEKSRSSPLSQFGPRFFTRYTVTSEHREPARHPRPLVIITEGTIARDGPREERGEREGFGDRRNVDAQDAYPGPTILVRCDPAVNRIVRASGKVVDARKYQRKIIENNYSKRKTALFFAITLDTASGKAIICCSPALHVLKCVAGFSHVILRNFCESRPAAPDRLPCRVRVLSVRVPASERALCWSGVAACRHRCGGFSLAAALAGPVFVFASGRTPCSCRNGLPVSRGNSGTGPDLTRSSA